MSLENGQIEEVKQIYNKRQEDNINFIIKHFKFMVSLVGMIVAAAGFYFKIETMMIQQDLIIKDIRTIKTALIKDGIINDFGLVSIEVIPSDNTYVNKDSLLKVCLLTQGDILRKKEK